ncbi:PREDICTED: transmembrane protein 40 [Gekko japonicus]|uniref:Transmembrane protein 40 n=1 Tax=Gekko japonicus TaxID=146911 RepID=A0ABM1LEN9_GEKJA|nr:PREDICTED: transmembrane protein 40 [Gekko japonicus]XP_015284427.1 PREDICTED: transmembrane protein 40 [Gekko japonicus]
MSNSDSSVPAHSAEHQDGKRKRVKKPKSQEDESVAGELEMHSQPQDSPKEIVPYSGSEVMVRDGTSTDVSENGACHLTEHPRWWIRKDDEFFHFVIVCFAVGTLLVCFYKYKDWTISVGVGLITFAALETTGIYFGLVCRIRAVMDSFIPLLKRVRLPGFKKTT